MNHFLKNKTLKRQSGLTLILFLFIIIACSRSNKSNYPISKKTHQENLIKANKGLVELDQDRISSYVKRRNWDMEISKTGMWFEIYDSANGTKAVENQIAHLTYQISLLDGTVCYSSDSTGVMQFKIGSGGVESGLEEAIVMMGVGDKGRFILPPHLAHGLLGDSKRIPPRSTIVYQAELIKLTDN